LRFLGKDDEAFDAFYKSVWNAAWMDSGYFQLARLAAKKQNWDEALELIDRTLIRNWHNHKARQQKVSILRKLGKIDEAEKWIEESLALDKFNVGVLFERYIITSDRVRNPVRGEELKTLLRANIHTYIEFALDFAYAGLFDEAIELISTGIEEQNDRPVYPMALYYKAWFEAQNGDLTASAETLQKAANACPDYCFPNQTEAVVVLEWAKVQNPSDLKAPYYLGNFWYNARQYDEAVLNWELSVKLDDQFPTVHRNLALAYFNKQNDSAKALGELEKAFALDVTDSRILMELDQLYKRLSFSPEERLQKLEKFPELVNFRDDLYLERVTLLNQLGRFEKAFELISARKFHPWEGGEGKVTGQYVNSLIGLAKTAIQNQEFEKAIELLEKAQVYPENLGEGKLTGAQENEIFYWLGCAYDELNNSGKATEYWEMAATGLEEPSPAIFYNDQQPDTIYFQGLALIKLGRKGEATMRFNKLINFGKSLLNDEFKLDYFAVSLPDLQIWDDDLTKRNNQNCKNLIALGEKGLNSL
jgi:tetratricopeptide (TPR) repeat protein